MSMVQEGLDERLGSPTTKQGVIFTVGQDPSGLDQHTPGAKLDKGKATYAMTLGYFKDALAAVDAVSRYGAAKYTPGGWAHVKDGCARYLEAALRHLMQHLSGEEIDEESGHSHLAHASWNLLAVMQLTDGDNSRVN